MSDPGTFKVTVPLWEVNDWLADPGADLIEVNSAIDEAASWANDYKRAVVIIEILSR